MIKTKSKSLIFDGMLLFLFIYAPVLYFFPLPLSKIVMLYLLGYVVLNKNILQILKEFSKYRFFKYTFFISVFIAVYFFNLTTWVSNYNYAFVQMFFWFLVEGVFSTFLLFHYLKSRYDLITILNLILNIIFIQSIFIVLAFVSFDIRGFFDNLLVVSDERYISSYRIRGFANSGGAGLSYLQCMGVFAGCLSLIFDDKNSIIKLLKLLVITVSLLFVARTGLIFSIIIILASLLQFSYNRGSVFLFIKYLLFSIVGVGLIYIFVVPVLPTETRVVLEDKVFERVFEFYYSYEATGELETRSTDALADMYILPESNGGVILGEGLWDSSGDRNDASFVKRQVNSDVGFVRLIFAIGIPLTFLFYTIYLVFCLDIKKVYFIKRIGILVVCLFLVFIIGETKEPFLARMSGIIKLLVLIYSIIISLNYNRSYSNT